MHQSDKETDPSPIDQEFIDRLTEISEAWYDNEFQRDKSGESIRFVDVPGAQWDDWYATQFANRPRLELDMTSQAVHSFNGEWRKGRFNVKFRPDDTAASEEDAELANKLYRTDFRKSNGTQAVDNAVSEMSKGGVGHLKMCTEYVSPDNPENKSQRIRFKPIVNSFNMVIWDPNSKEQDKSDAGWVCLITTYTKKAFKKAYPDLDATSFPFQPDINTNNIFHFTNQDLIYVAEFYEVKERKGMAFSYTNRETGEKRTIWKDEIKDHLDTLIDFGFEKTGERKIRKRTIEKSIMYGGGYISTPKRIAGEMLPIIPCYGWRSYIDNQEWYYGLVQKKKDAQRAINMAFSNNVENAASSPKSMPILTAEQISGLETRWSEQHLGKYNYAVINGKDEDGEDLPLGPVGFIEPAKVDPNSQNIVDTGAAYIQGQSGAEPADQLNPDASGEAIKESIARINLLTYEPMDNIALFLQQVGKCYIGMAEEVYAEQRYLHLVNEDESEEMILLQEFIPDPKDPKGFIKVNDITKKTFDCIVDTGPSYQNMRREVVKFLSDIIAQTDSNSPYMPLLYGTMIENIEGVGMDDIKDFNRKQMLMAGYIEPETDKEKEFVQQLIQARQQEGQQGDPTQQLILQEAQRAASEARENDQNAKYKQADTRKTLAEAEAIEIENAMIKSGLADVLKQAEQMVPN